MITPISSSSKAANSDSQVKTSVCDEYEQLLIASQRAMERWRSGSAEITQFDAASLDRKSVFDQLLRLQADYARAYERLLKHKNKCHVCQFVSRMSHRMSAPHENFRRSA